MRVGIDIVEINRVERFMKRWHTFASHLCSGTEAVAAKELIGRGRAVFYAGRLAAKEAFLKATGCGLHDIESIGEISVVNKPSGEPGFELSGSAARLIARLGWREGQVSISHDGNYAVAVVVLISEDSC